MSGRGGIASGLLLAVLVFAGPARAGDGWAERLADTASAVWSAVGPERRLAARPVDPDESGLPNSLAADVDSALAAALLRAAPAAGRLIDRSALPASWEEAKSFRGASTEQLLREAAVDALVIPSAHATRDGIVLSATVVGVGGGDTGRLLAALAPVTLPGSIDRLAARPPAAASRIAGVALADALRLALDPAARFRSSVRLTGDRSPFGDWFLGQVAEHLTARLAERPLYVSRPIRAADVDGRAVAVRLEAEIWDHRDRVEIHLRALTGTVEARATARLDAATLPAHFRPLTPDGGRLGTGYRIADGAAAVGPALRRDELTGAAEAIARARMIDDLLDADATPAVARSRDDVAAAWRRLAVAVTHGEDWSGSAIDRGASAARLRARVVRVGGPQAPELDATLDRAVYRPGNSLRVRLAVRERRAFVALYAWQADGSVVRMAPRGGGEPAEIAAGRRVELPGPHDAEVTAAPMPDADESLEAVMVVASAVPFRPDRLAPALGATADASRQRAVTAGAFLERLAGLDLTLLRLAILPYRVRAAD